MDPTTVYDAFVVTATGPFDALQSWVGSHRGFVYPVSAKRDPHFAEPGNSYVMIIPRDEDVPMPSKESGIQITDMQQVGPP
jgi:hypothetical protein